MFKALSSKLPALVLLLTGVFALSGFGCRQNTAVDQSTGELVVWGLWQESADMEPVLKAFAEQYGTKVTYKKIASVATYERDLLSALAEGRGPDVFVIHHNWVNDKQRLMTPAPANIIDERAVRDEFVDVAAADLVRGGQVYALPSSVDTLAMYYNKDLLNAAGIARPPRTWTDFQQMIERVTKVNRLGTIQQSAAALGTAGNINRASDIFQLLMMQSGLSIFDAQNNKVSINNDIGARALTFYTDFANKSKKVYTWNLQQDYSIDAFAAGKTAVMFNYSYSVPTIKAKNPRLNFGVAEIPQIAGSSDSNRVNFASYWPFAVSNSSRSPNMAWNFVRFLTSKNPSDSINRAALTPPARRDSVVELQRDASIGVFAEQAITAQSWPRFDSAAVDTILNAAIDNVVTGAATSEDALRQAEEQINNLTPAQ
ncbi:MAG: extracellular solute-binding protein [bacterium]|nr:extracellular solute-binding protein [bacterium]